MIAQPKQDETYYDILKVDRKATIAEIVAAYHTAKNAFSRDSVATYSLFSTDEVKSVIEKLDEAYQNLSNLDKKREYDRWLQEQSENPELPPAMSELERKQNAQLLPKDSESLFPAAAPQTGGKGDASAPQAAAAVDATPIELPSNEALSGLQLKSIREKRGLSLDDVSRITKIPSKFIRAIEADDIKHLPARVYLQGFIKNMASLYKLDSKVAVTAYFAHTDKANPPTETP